MLIDRRTMLAGDGSGALAAPAMAQSGRRRRHWYDQAIIIDALGGTGDP